MMKYDHYSLSLNLLYNYTLLMFCALCFREEDTEERGKGYLEGNYRLQSREKIHLVASICVFVCVCLKLLCLSNLFYDLHF